MKEDKQNVNNVSGPPPARRPSYALRRIVICTVIILAGIGVARYMIQNKQKVSRRPPEKIAPLVEVRKLSPESYPVRIEAMGTVIPSREIVLRVPVGGEIINMHDNFAVGGQLKAGEQLLQIDPIDYQLALQQKQRALTNAEYEYLIEQGRQDVARQEWDLLYGGKAHSEVESTLALRKPHLDKVQAEIKAAKAELEQAKVNLARTDVKAPFNALVRNKYVDMGSYVSPQEKLADLVGTDEFWVQVSLPVERLHWVTIPEGENGQGSEAVINYRKTMTRQGTVLRLMADLSQQGRMARLLISVRDPLGLGSQEVKQPPLLIGEFVRVSIEGETLNNVYRIPRTALRNNGFIWLAGEKDTLMIRPVEILWRDEGNVLIRDGIKPGDRLVVSALPAPVDGMMIRTGSEQGNPVKAHMAGGTDEK